MRGLTKRHRLNYKLRYEAPNHWPTERPTDRPLMKVLFGPIRIFSRESIMHQYFNKDFKIISQNTQGRFTGGSGGGQGRARPPPLGGPKKKIVGPQKIFGH